MHKGSIGSEIVRQLNKLLIFLILLDIDESGLHYLYNNLDNRDKCSFLYVMFQIFRLERIVQQYKYIDKIFMQQLINMFQL